MTTPTQTNRAYEPLSVSPLSFWAQTAEDRERTFKALRDTSPVSWQPPVEGGLMPPENDGFWAITRHEHIVEVSKNSEIYSSAQGVMLEEVPQDFLDASQSFLAMDAPQHGRLRRLVSSAFTPKQVTKIEAQIKNQAQVIVGDLLDTGECDFVQHVSKRLPMWTIYEMVGLPTSLQEEAAHHADGMVAWADEEVAAGRSPGEVLNDSLVGLLTIAMDFANHRRTNPSTDLMTNLVQAEIDGVGLTDDEIAAFFVLLSVAGNDTTRNTITLTTKALCDFPEQKKLLLEDFSGRIGSALEEAVRWATPVMSFRRTATQDTVLGGQQIATGEWVVMFYPSGNRDERVFNNPDTFDIMRSTNPHVAFGGGGVHYCMGNVLAKTQLREIFNQLLHRVPKLTVGEPNYLVGNFVRAVKSMPCSIS